MQWYKLFGKEAKESRFAIFADNLYEAERYASSRGGKVQLSAFADLTTAEYRRREEEVERWNRYDESPTTTAPSRPTRKIPRRQEDRTQWDSEFPSGRR